MNVENMKTGIKSWIVDNKNGIYVGVIGCVVWQLISMICKIAPNVGNNIVDTIRNFYYSTSATMSTSRMISYLFSILVGMTFGIGLSVLLIRIVRKIIIKRESKITKEDSKSSYKKVFFTLNRGLNIMGISLIIITIILGFNVASYDLKILFDLDMQSIKPYISENDYDALYSKWTQMKTKKDYNNIYNEIKLVQREYNLRSARSNIK